jgi:signal transduction histidine kinase
LPSSKALLPSSDPWRELFLEEAPDACVILDGELRYRYFNRAAAGLLHFSLDEMRGKELVLLEESAEARERLAMYRATLADGLPRDFDTIKPEGEGGERIFRIRVFKVDDGLGFIWTETTEEERVKRALVSAQEELRSLTSHLVEIREEERKGLARELHDELGQTLTAVEMELRFLSRTHSQENGRAKEKIGELLVMTSQSIRAVMRICSELRPAILDRLGLRAAIEWLAEASAARSSLNARAELDFEEGPIGPKASTALFRIAQEAMMNVVRHARASEAVISLKGGDGAIELVVTDDGIGISADQASAPDSYGILGIKERARAFGGTAAIGAAAGAGTRLAVSLPLPVEGFLP